MELKDYQIKVLDTLSAYLQELEAARQDKEDYYQFQLSKNNANALSADYSDYPTESWNVLRSKIELPLRDGKVVPYQPRLDGMKRHIPNICFKVPTGGGKTLLAARAVQYINQDYFKRNTGLVLWIVPSDTIYTQTSKQLRNREHHYRQILDAASVGRTRILEKGDRFNIHDVQNNLCVMLLMLQSGNRQNKHALRMFKDSGGFESFFPPLDDYLANNILLSEVTNLDCADLGDDGEAVITGLSVKHSLGNVMKILRPIVVFDEGHRGASQLAQDTVNSFNPSFILELSATPKPYSNLLVSVSGNILKDEHMIKLPINLKAFSGQNWQHALNLAHAKLQALEQDAVQNEMLYGDYIRPIMVIKAEAKKKDDTFDHVQAIKEYLIKNLQVSEDNIRIKLSDTDELGDTDLLRNDCAVRYIITKDALKEGWDCPFAYVLAILTNARSDVALTQLVGRVLRQPYARRTKADSLNECFVFCIEEDVQKAVESIKKGLEEQGLEDIAGSIVPQDANANLNNQKKHIKVSRQCSKNEKIYLPTLNAVNDKGEVQPFDYYQHILSDIDWQSYSYDAKAALVLIDKDESSQAAKIDIENGKTLPLFSGKQSEYHAYELNISLMVSQFMTIFPNAYVACDVIINTINALRDAGHKDEKIAANAIEIIEDMKKAFKKWAARHSEQLFRTKLEGGKIFLKLLSAPYSDFNWELLEDKYVVINLNEQPYMKYDKSIFPQFASQVNGLEEKIAGFINGRKTVEWWHRLAVRGSEYALQGWQKNKIFPDFLVKIENDENDNHAFRFIEAKGMHLEGNQDTEYKKALFELLNGYVQGDVKPIGDFKIVGNQHELSFHMVMEDSWKNEIPKILNEV